MTGQNLTGAAVDLADLVSVLGVTLNAVAHALDKNKVIAKAEFASVLRQAAAGIKDGKPNHPRGEDRADVSMLSYFADCH